VDPGNTLGAIVFLAAGTWLGWTVVSGRAQNFLAAMAGGKSNGSGGPPGAAKPPATVHGGHLAGVNLDPADPSYTPPDPYAIPKTVPNVFGDAFGQNAPLNSGAYGPYSWDYSQSYDPLVFTPQDQLGGQTFNQVFGLP
jgi:hypothetical protein